jgi:hypothetical protein
MSARPFALASAVAALMFSLPTCAADAASDDACFLPLEAFCRDEVRSGSCPSYPDVLGAIERASRQRPASCLAASAGSCEDLRFVNSVRPEAARALYFDAQDRLVAAVTLSAERACGGRVRYGRVLACTPKIARVLCGRQRLPER